MRLLLTPLLIPVFLVGFTVVDELGHTLLARAAGDTQAVFYLWRVDENGACLGCTNTDHTKLTTTENLVVVLGGLLATQPVAVLLLLAGQLTGAGQQQLKTLMVVICAAWLTLFAAFYYWRAVRLPRAAPGPTTKAASGVKAHDSRDSMDSGPRPRPSHPSDP